MRDRLVVHVGTHKTGSTTLQAQMLASTDGLWAVG